MRKKILLTVAALLLSGGIALYVMNREPPADTRFTGAYRLDDGALVVVAPRDDKTLRFKLMNGDTGALWPTGEADGFEGGPGWAEQEPVINRVRFQRNERGLVSGLTWQRTENAVPVDHKATRLPLHEEIVTFPSGELSLRGKLMLPEGPGPFPAVVVVHGSE